MADSSNSSQSTGSQSTGSQTSSNASTSGATTSNSTGNFSGGLPGLGGESWSSRASETDAAHASGVQGPGLSNGNFGSSWSGNENSGGEVPGIIHYGNTISVDSVFGKSAGNGTGTVGNQSVVESQGDYEASSNEQSDVDTSTFGKQDNITVTPESVTENKGLVDNDAIDSLEGLNFQQKDKQSQDVMEGRKSRDDAESEDKANQMRESIRSKTFEVDEDAVSQFQLGDRDEEEAALANDTQEKGYAAKEAAKAVNEFAEARGTWMSLQGREDVSKADMDKAAAVFSKYGLDEAYDASLNDNNPWSAKEQFQTKSDEVSKSLTEASEVADKAAKHAHEAYDSFISSKYVGAEEAPEAEATIAEEAPAENAVSDTDQAFDSAIQDAIDAGADEETVQAMTDIAANIKGAKADIQKAVTENDFATYVNAQKQLNENYNKAFDNGNPLTQTDYNKSFVAAVAKANDFDVTLADGTKQSYSEFATEAATKSPEIAKAMYEAKADQYTKDNHPVLAAIERGKAKMVGTWLGSKLTQADNQVRGQFNQMAKTNMRATYATYNNVLSDPNASPEAKAEASTAINQANSLMTASAALQASTGFLSGIGDSTKDGVYGVTDPGALNAYQKTLNAIDNFTKITLGLGVSPGANKAYQNMYYMAGDKVNKSFLFNKDFDSDGFALCQEYGNNAAAGMIAGAGELAAGIALFFNPAMAGMGLNLTVDSIQTFTNGLYGVQKDARKSKQYTQEVLSYFKEAESIASEADNKEASDAISRGIDQIENFELKSDEVGNLDNWLEGSGSNTATNEKFNQSLSYDEWLKLIEADPTMQEYARKLTAEKKEK